MQNKNSSGISGMTLLTVAFIVLKLCGVIKWSWWWVLSPIWAGLIIYIIVICIYVNWLNDD